MKTSCALATLVVLLAGCGYSTKRLDAFPSARTVAVVPFTSPGFRRDLDLRVTQAVVDEIRSRTSYGFATPGRADLVISGTMRVREIVTLQRPDREVVGKRLQGGIEVTVRDGRTGRVLKSFNAGDTLDYTPGREGETLEGSAYTNWSRRVAIRVVQGLETGL